jgi:amino acid permease
MYLIILLMIIIFTGVMVSYFGKNTITLFIALVAGVFLTFLIFIISGFYEDTQQVRYYEELNNKISNFNGNEYERKEINNRIQDMNQRIIINKLGINDSFMDIFYYKKLSQQEEIKYLQ